MSLSITGNLLNDRHVAFRLRKFTKNIHDYAWRREDFSVIQWPQSRKIVAHYSKKGIPGMAYFFIPSSFISTPIPGFSERVIKLLFTHSPS